MSRVSVSVVIPTYNRVGLVNQTVRNVLHQSLPPDEVIIVDDGSVDNTVDSLNREFGTAITIVQQSNQGPGEARNAGLRLASGEYIWLMDSDDLASLNKLEVQTEALIRSGADIAYGPWMKARIEDFKVIPENVVLQQRALPANRSCLEWFLNDWSNVFQQCLLRRELFERTPGFRTDIHYGEDGELFVRMLVNGAKMVFDDRALTLYRLGTSDQLTSSAGGSCRRHSGWAAALTAMYGTVCSSVPAGIQSGFLARLQNAVRDLQECSANHSEQIRECEHILSLHAHMLPGATERQIVRVCKGLRQRLRGHRWGHAYQCDQLTQHQRSLISLMGLELH